MCEAEKIGIEEMQPAAIFGFDGLFHFNIILI